MNYNIILKVFFLFLLNNIKASNNEDSLPFPESWKMSAQLLQEAGNKKELIKQQLCQTLPDKPLDDKYRHWIYQAGIDLKIPKNPANIIGVNDKASEKGGAMGGNIHVKTKNGPRMTIGIILNMLHFNQFPIGVGRAVIYHEVAHIKPDNLKHPGETQKNYLLSRILERLADKDGVLAGNCYKCTQEFAAYHLGYLRNGPYRTLSLATFEKLSKKQLDQKIENEQWRSENVTNNSHPSALERALYLFKISLAQKKEQRICEYHVAIRKDQEKKAQQKTACPIELEAQLPKSLPLSLLKKSYEQDTFLTLIRKKCTMEQRSLVSKKERRLRFQ